MTILYILPIFFLCIAIFYALDKSLKNKKIFVKNPKLRINYSFKSWKFEDYAALSIVIIITLLCLLALIISLGAKIEKIIPQTLFILICASSTALAIKNLKLNKWYTRYSATFKITATFITVILTLKSSAQADSTLIYFTNIDPGQFPTAQKIMTFIGLILNWLILAMYASLIIYAACFFIIIFPINGASKKREAVLTATHVRILKKTIIATQS
ncbi:hypothetical protein [Pseudomonas asplenii]|uniref:hypothetical protein n=1 Tax=Pseudomonas asplenii TaxID=53407 RepID=UPI0022345EDD|nr:hypothetical protein [Pseudomonas asplenii]UZE30775.1 hypothetical protein LOY63_08615 [Pseudomonas asplenii]